MLHTPPAVLYGNQEVHLRQPRENAQYEAEAPGTGCKRSHQHQGDRACQISGDGISMHIWAGHCPLWRGVRSAVPHGDFRQAR